MFRRMAIAAALAATVGAAPIFAQSRDPRAEVSVFAGWSFSDGVSGNSVTAPNGQIYNRVDPKDSFNWGLALGFLVTHNAEVGFRYGMQPSQLIIGGTTDTTLGDMSISNYHGYFAYNFGESDAHIRPYIYGGLGATSFGSVSATLGANSRTIPGETKFSSIWGGGVKIVPNQKVGVRIGIDWVPTYIKSDTTGYWCDPFWGCYLVGSAQYSNQFQFNGGVVFRF